MQKTSCKKCKKISKRGSRQTDKQKNREWGVTCWDSTSIMCLARLWEPTLLHGFWRSSAWTRQCVVIYTEWKKNLKGQSVGRCFIGIPFCGAKKGRGPGIMFDKFGFTRINFLNGCPTTTFWPLRTYPYDCLQICYHTFNLYGSMFNWDKVFSVEVALVNKSMREQKWIVFY